MEIKDLTIVFAESVMEEDFYLVIEREKYSEWVANQELDVADLVDPALFAGTFSECYMYVQLLKDGVSVQ